MTRLLALSLAAVSLACSGTRAPSVPGSESPGISTGPQADGVAPERAGSTTALPLLSVTSTMDSSPLGETRASELQALVFNYHLVGVGTAEFSVEFRSPGGDAYEKRVSALSGSGFEPQDVQVTLPVAGTHIDQNRLLGTWHATAFLGGAQVSDRTFDVTE